jgi:hypothetical protein
LLASLNSFVLVLILMLLFAKTFLTMDCQIFKRAFLLSKWWLLIFHDDGFSNLSWVQFLSIKSINPTKILPLPWMDFQSPITEQWITLTKSSRRGCWGGFSWPLTPMFLWHDQGAIKLFDFSESSIIYQINSFLFVGTKVEINFMFWVFWQIILDWNKIK